MPPKAEVIIAVQGNDAIARLDLYKSILKKDGHTITFGVTSKADADGLLEVMPATTPIAIIDGNLFKSKQEEAEFIQSLKAVNPKISIIGVSDEPIEGAHVNVDKKIPSEIMKLGEIVTAL